MLQKRYIKEPEIFFKNYPDLAPKVNHIEPNWHQVAPKRANGKGRSPPLYDDLLVPPPEIEQKLTSEACSPAGVARGNKERMGCKFLAVYHLSRYISVHNFNVVVLEIHKISS